MSDTNGRNSYPNQPYQSAWMSHWKQTNCGKMTEKLSCPSGVSGNAESGRDNKGASGNEERGSENKCDSMSLELEVLKSGKCDSMSLELEVLKSGKGLGVLESKTPEMTNGSLIMGHEIYGKRGFGSFLVEQGQEIGDHMLVAKPVAGLHFEQGKAVGIKSNLHLQSMLSRIISERQKFLDEGTSISKNPLKWVPTDFSAEAASNSFHETVIGSSVSMPHKHGPRKMESHDEKTKASSLIDKASIDSNMLWKNPKRKMLYESGQPADLVCERKQDDPSQSHLMHDCFREGSSPFLFNVPSTSDGQFAAFNEQLFQKMQKRSGLSLSSDQDIVSQKMDARKSFYDSYSLQKFSNCVQNVETMRICATVGERTQRGYPGFSQTSHSFLITKMTDVNSPNECDIINTTRVITSVNRNTPSSQDKVFPFCNWGKKGVVLLPLSSSTDSEGKADVDVKNSKVALNDESSAETDTMDVDFSKDKNLHSRAKFTPSEKGFKLDSNLSSQIDISSREAESQRPQIRLPYINLELPPLPAAARSFDSSGHNSSKTQSLEMDVLVAHAELSPKPMFNICSDDSGKEDPNNRWVKRLKLSSSQSSSHVPKGSYLAESMSNKKMKQFMSRILSSSITSSEPTLEKHHGKSVLLDKIDLSKDNNPIKKNKESLLSHSWIQRWLHEGSGISRKNSGTMLVCEPQSSKCTLDNLQNQQFPSIGAMTLMGKAMRGSQSCELQRRGSFTLWNTKAV